MNKRFGLYYIIGVFALLCFGACAEDESFSVSRTDVLSFSLDTIRLDTTFSNVPTPTKAMWVYNRTGKGLRCSSVRLENGNQTGFRVNVDGIYLSQASGFKAQDVEIRKGDSIRVFVELTSATQGVDEPKLVEDNLVFSLESGMQQKVNLHAMSWDAELLRGGMTIPRGKDSVFVSKKPVVVYGGVLVDSLASLTIGAGTTLYLHGNAGVKVYGTLKLAGEAGAEVTLRGDRLDRMFAYLPYDRTPGQWQGIWLMESSYGNEFHYADIHSAYYGVKMDSSDVNRNKLLVQNTTIHNCQGDGVRAEYAKVQLYNSQITNMQGHCLYACGGDVDVNNCTLAQFYPFSGGRATAIGFEPPLQNLNVMNSLVTGYAKDEIVWTAPKEEDVFNFAFDHSVLRTEKMQTEDSLKFTNIIFEEEEVDSSRFGEKQFLLFDTDNLIYDFRLKNTSAAVGAADPTTALPIDRNGVKRDEEKSDAGCYQHQVKKEDEE